MDDIKRLIAMQSANRFLIETAYRVVAAAFPDDARADLLRDLRDPRSRLTASQGGDAAERSEMEAMIHADLDAFADRLECPRLTS